FAQTYIDFFSLGWLPVEGCRNCKVLFEQWEPSIENFQLATILHARISFSVKITNAHYLLESLCAHGAGVHAQSPADCAGNSLHPFQPSKICRARCVSHLPQFYARACCDFAPVYVDFLEISTAWMNNDPAYPAVPNQKV